MNNEQSTKYGVLKTLLIYVIIGIVLSFGVRLFIEPTVVVGDSMSPTLQEGEYMLNNKIGYSAENAEFGDVVVVTEGNKHLIKRVIGLPNDVVEIKDNEVFINEEKIDEPYIKEKMKYTQDMVVELKEDELFVMGDNRNNSLDSRTLGPIQNENIRGEIIFRINPFNQQFKY